MNCVRLMLIACVVVLAGCDVMPRLPAKTQYVLVEPDKQMLQDCPQVAPPDVEVLVAATPKQREGLYVDLSLEQMDTIAKCNKQWGELRGWYDKQRKIYTEKK